MSTIFSRISNKHIILTLIAIISGINSKSLNLDEEKTELSEGPNKAVNPRVPDKQKLPISVTSYMKPVRKPITEGRLLQQPVFPENINFGNSTIAEYPLCTVSNLQPTLDLVKSNSFSNLEPNSSGVIAFTTTAVPNNEVCTSVCVIPGVSYITFDKNGKWNANNPNDPQTSNCLKFLGLDVSGYDANSPILVGQGNDVGVMTLNGTFYPSNSIEFIPIALDQNASVTSGEIFKTSPAFGQLNQLPQSSSTIDNTFLNNNCLVYQENGNTIYMLNFNNTLAPIYIPQNGTQCICAPGQENFALFLQDIGLIPSNLTIAADPQIAEQINLGYYNNTLLTGYNTSNGFIQTGQDKTLTSLGCTMPMNACTNTIYDVSSCGVSRSFLSKEISSDPSFTDTGYYQIATANYNGITYSILPVSGGYLIMGSDGRWNTYPQNLQLESWESVFDLQAQNIDPKISLYMTPFGRTVFNYDGNFIPTSEDTEFYIFFGGKSLNKVAVAVGVTIGLVAIGASVGAVYCYCKRVKTKEEFERIKADLIEQINRPEFIIQPEVHSVELKLLLIEAINDAKEPQALMPYMLYVVEKNMERHQAEGVQINTRTNLEEGNEIEEHSNNSHMEFRPQKTSLIEVEGAVKKNPEYVLSFETNLLSQLRLQKLQKTIDESKEIDFREENEEIIRLLTANASEFISEFEKLITKLSENDFKKFPKEMQKEVEEYKKQIEKRIPQEMELEVENFDRQIERLERNINEKIADVKKTKEAQERQKIKEEEESKRLALKKEQEERDNEEKRKKLEAEQLALKKEEEERILQEKQRKEREEAEAKRLALKKEQEEKERAMREKKLEEERLALKKEEEERILQEQQKREVERQEKLHEILLEYEQFKEAFTIKSRVLNALKEEVQSFEMPFETIEVKNEKIEYEKTESENIKDKLEGLVMRNGYIESIPESASLIEINNFRRYFKQIDDDIDFAIREARATLARVEGENQERKQRREEAKKRAELTAKLAIIRDKLSKIVQPSVTGMKKKNAADSSKDWSRIAALNGELNTNNLSLLEERINEAEGIIARANFPKEEKPKQKQRFETIKTEQEEEEKPEQIGREIDLNQYSPVVLHTKTEVIRIAPSGTGTNFNEFQESRRQGSSLNRYGDNKPASQSQNPYLVGHKVKKTGKPKIEQQIEEVIESSSIPSKKNTIDSTGNKNKDTYLREDGIMNYESNNTPVDGRKKTTEKGRKKHDFGLEVEGNNDSELEEYKLDWNAVEQKVDSPKNPAKN